jgi:hypothetical protein
MEQISGSTMQHLWVSTSRARWLRSPATALAAYRRIYLDAVEAAHLVPQADGSWFLSNDMERSCHFPTDLHPINDEKNPSILRRDLHHLPDTRRFTFAVKSFSTPPPPPAAEPSPDPADPSANIQLALHAMLSL